MTLLVPNRIISVVSLHNCTISVVDFDFFELLFSCCANYSSYFDLYVSNQTVLYIYIQVML